MAQTATARKLHIEPEAPNEQLAPRLRSTRHRPQGQLVWIRTALTVAGVACVVLAVITFVSTYAQIAAAEYRQRAMRQEYAQLTRECTELRLDLARLAAQPNVATIAQKQGLTLPDANRVHYVNVASVNPAQLSGGASATARRTTPVGQRLLASLHHAWQVLGPGPTEKAFAR